MPYKVGNGPPILDVFSSDNVFINGVKVALAGQGENAALPDASAAFASVPQDDYADIPEAEEIAGAEKTADYVANPDKYYNPEANEIAGTKPNYPGTPDAESANTSPPLNIPGAKDIVPWLAARLKEAEKNLWDESGMGGNPSNPNITNIWKNIGMGTTGMWASDQTAWCAGFMNFCLKCCGYRYVASAQAYGIRNNPSKWGASQIAIDQGQPGDIVVWNYSHVNFLYTAGGGGGVGPPYSFVGGNQSDKGGRNNNPSGGSITNSWKSGWTPAKGGITGIYRPVKV